jgi:hypothetical protein
MYIFFQKKFMPDGTGGSRKIVPFHSKEEQEKILKDFADDHDVLDPDAGPIVAERLIAQTPTICIAIDSLLPLFDENGKIVTDKTNIDLIINKAGYGVIAILEKQEECGVQPKDCLPENLRVLPLIDFKDTDKQFFIKSLRNSYSTGNIYNPQDLVWLLKGMVTIRTR